MGVICPVCSTPTIRGLVDADLVRHRSLRKIAERYGLSIRSVQRHLKHLPALLESEASAAGPSVYIGQVTYNFNVLVSPPEDEVGEGEEEPIGKEHGGGGA